MSLEPFLNAWVVSLSSSPKAQVYDFGGNAAARPLMSENWTSLLHVALQLLGRMAGTWSKQDEGSVEGSPLSEASPGLLRGP